MAGPEAQSRRPQDTDFKQQRLKAWQPILTPRWVIGSFFVLGFVFIPIGAVILVASNSVVEYSVPYHNEDDCHVTDPAQPKQCAVSFTITEEMKPPIYFYYELSNFYQNHRRYVKSRSETQLKGSSPDDVSGCEPLQSNDTSNQNFYPCGLIANSMFTDQFVLTYADKDRQWVSLNDRLTDKSHLNFSAETWRCKNNKDCPNWTHEDIAWKSDKDKFNIPKQRDPNLIDPPAFQEAGLSFRDVEDEDFMVWMRTAGLPTFKKLYRRLPTQTFDPNTNVTVLISSQFPVDSFSGTKSFVLSTTSWLGGKNTFLGWAYIIVGIICIVLALAFLLKHYKGGRTLGDMTSFRFSSAEGQRMY